MSENAMKKQTDETNLDETLNESYYKYHSILPSIQFNSMIELDIMVLECIPGFKVLVDRFVFVLVVFVLVVFVLVLVLVLRVGIAERSIPSITLPEKEQFRICDLICSLTRELSMAHVLLFKFPFPFPSSF
ncbi:unnamed protein product, partial [marine sediment metagenome]